MRTFIINNIYCYAHLLAQQVSDKPAALDTRRSLSSWLETMPRNLSHCKLRRQNRIGRGLPAVAHIAQLAATNAPSLHTVLAAVTLVCQERAPQIGCLPGDLLPVSCDNAWIYE